MTDSLNSLPPQNIEAEEAILGGILLDPEAMGRVMDILVSNAFYIKNHQHIYLAASKLFQQGFPTDLMTVSNWLADQGLLEKIGGNAKLAQLVDRTVSAVNIDRYSEFVMEKYIRRQLISAGNEIVDLGYDTSKDIETVLDQSEQKIFSLSQEQPQQGLTSLSDTLVDTYTNLEELHAQTALPGLSCGFYDLDGKIGGFQRSDLVIIAGRPAMGKTSLALNIASNIGQIHKLPVAVFSLEMSKQQLAQRLIASEAGIESNRLRSGRFTQNEYEPLMNAIGNLSAIPLFIDDTANITVMQMRSQLRRLQVEQGGKLGLVLIDYLQLMEGSTSDNRVQELSKITRSLKGLARELNVPVIALSQLSRGVEQRTNKRPMLSDLRESGCLSGDSLVIMADTGEEIPLRDLEGKSGFAIWALNTETKKIQRAIVSNAWNTGIKPVWELTTNLGRTIKATANHKFLTIQGWKRLDGLEKGERIALPRQIPCSELQTMGDAELALLGHLIGDGCTLPRHAIQYTTRELDLAEIVSNLATQVFGDSIAPKIKQEKTWYQVYLSASYHLTHGIKNPVSKWLENLGIFGLRSHEKFIPGLVFQQPQEAIALFLRHLWSTDGCIKLTKGSSYPAIYYASSSNKLAQGVQMLLLRLGINAKLRIISQGKKGRNQIQVWITGKYDLEKFVNLIGAVGLYKQESLELVKQYLQKSGKANPNQDVIPRDIWHTEVKSAQQQLAISDRQLQQALGISYCGTSLYKYNLSRNRTKQLAEILQSETINNLADSDIYWDEIKEIKFAGEEKVYDLTVPNLENFTTQGLYVHNSIEQDADLVIMLYRDNYYNPDSPERDLAEINIAKHRHGPTGIIKLIFQPELTRFLNLANPNRP